MTTLHKPKHRHSHILFGWAPIRIRFFFSEHKNGGLGEAELVDQQVLHTLGVVNAALELVPGALIRHGAYQSPLASVSRRRRPRRRVVVGRSGRRRWAVEGGGGGRRRKSARVGDAGDGLADGAADGLSSRWQLQRRAAA